MVFSNLSNFVIRRSDLSRQLEGFLKSHMKSIIAVESHLVILRIIRTISYYPSAMYFLYVETQMGTGKAFILQGIKCFERILKSNRYPQLLQLLVKILKTLMGVIRISDPIFELIVINYYDSMLKASPSLYFRCRQKIKQQFYLNKDSNQHSTLICFNLIYALLKKQKDEHIRNEILSIFYDITEHLMVEENRQAYKKYE